MILKYLVMRFIGKVLGFARLLFYVACVALILSSIASVAWVVSVSVFKFISGAI